MCVCTHMICIIYENAKIYKFIYKIKFLRCTFLLMRKLDSFPSLLSFDK